MADIDYNAESRLGNLENIEPLLASLRILSLSTMQMAMNRRSHLQAYKNNFFQILSHLLKAVKEKEREKIFQVGKTAGQSVLVVLGSDRGICGTYNKNLAALTLKWQKNPNQDQIIYSFGTRLNLALNQSEVIHEDKGSISKGSIPDYHKAHKLVDQWLQAFSEDSIRTVEILSYRKSHRGFYQPEISPLIPNSVHVDENIPDFFEWPEPIIEGDPLLLIRRVIDHLTSLNYQELILESIEAENTIRYNLLEEAKENMQELIDSLSLDIQIKKRQKITEQIQELAIGAGLIE